MSNLLFVGVDDGHNNTCIYTSEGLELVIPSRAVVGDVKKFAIGSQESKTFTYKSGDDIYTVGEIDKATPTNFNEYPVSTMNRAIVNHALHLAKLGGKNLSIVTGLPVRHYYKYSGMNDKLIKNKRNNLLSSSLGGKIQSLDNFELPNILKHQVIAEGIAAWLDHAVTLNEDGSLDMDKDFINERVAVIDIGGRTTDIAVIKAWEVDPQRSATIDAGMLSVHDAIRGMVKEEFEAELDDEQIYKAVDTNKVKVFGQYEDITQIVDTAKKQALGQISNEVKRKIGSGGDLTKIIFVGGGSLVFGELLKDWYPKNGEISDNPLFANARGMMKCAMLMVE